MDNKNQITDEIVNGLSKWIDQFYPSIFDLPKHAAAGDELRERVEDCVEHYLAHELHWEYNRDLMVKLRDRFLAQGSIAK
ncbi:MAG: hypothetical protein ACE37H_17030 [Phycisphaeraceae bacterium]